MRCHYIPRYYLKQFATNEKIFVYDLKTRKPYITNIKNVAVEKNFNAANVTCKKNNCLEFILSLSKDPPRGDSKILESTFSKIESDSKKAIDNIISTKKIIRDDLFNKLLIQMALLFLNNPHFRQKAQEQMIPHFKNEGDKILSNKEDLIQKTKIEPTKEDIEWAKERFNCVGQSKEVLMSVILSDKLLGMVIHSLKIRNWVVRIIDNSELVTSDNPVTLYPYPELKHKRKYIGWGTYKTFVCFPLSPSFFILGLLDNPEDPSTENILSGLKVEDINRYTQIDAKYIYSKNNDSREYILSDNKDD